MTNEQVVALVLESLEKAEEKHPQWPDNRHGHSVIREEFQEFENAVYTDSELEAFKEVTQLAAMCLRYMKNHAPSSIRLFH